MARETVAQFTIADVPAARVLRFECAHEAGRPLALDVEVILYAYEEPDAMIGKGARLSFGAPGEAPRIVAGIVESVTVIGSTEMGLQAPGARYALRVVSCLALLARSVDSRIFQDMTAQEIVTQVLADHGVDRIAWRLSGGCPKREYCVQYQESALAFLSRLLEHEGIYSFVEVDDEGELLVFDDDSTVAAPIPGDPALPLRRRTGLSAADERDAIYAIREQERVRSGKFVLRDYDFKRPQLDLTATAEAGERAELERYDYPGGYVEPSEGERLAQIRLEEEQVERRTVAIDAVCPRLAVGHKMAITDAGELDGEYFLFAVTHTFVHNGEDDEGQGSAPRSRTRARLVPASVKYRPRRVTPIPVIEGPQTARVVAPAGAQPEAIHTDEHGRCKVKFHWDRSDVNDDKASCWIRVAQLQTSGSMMLPRVGWEVIVEFLEGNPDRPLVTGRLYNGVFMPPYALPEGKTRTAIRTASTPGGGGANEIRFEDKAGAEEIMVHAQYDMKTAAANNAKKTIGNNETSVVGNNASLEVGGNQTTKITKGSSNTVGADQSIKVGGNRNVEVNAVSALTAKGNATTTVGGNQFEMDGNPLEAMLALAAQTAVQFASVMANNAISAIQGQVDGAINQVMGPINALNQQVQGVSGAMRAVAAGNMSGMPAMIAGASGIPGASQLAASMGGGGGGSASRAGLPGRGGGAGDGGGAPGGSGPPNMLASIAANVAHSSLAGRVFVEPQALAGALGLDSGGGGGESMANASGPEGNVDGVDATDREKGPGHSTAKVAGTHAETVGAMKVVGAVQDIDNNVTGKKTLDVGAATVQVAFGSYAESVTGSKTEKATGLIVLSNAGESETITGSRTAMVGGAVVDKLKGSHVVQAVGPATFIGAFHKVEAKGAIVFKCGASEVVIDGGGVTITSPMVAFLAPKIQLPKKVSEV
ncbi:type VI secretion system Vgr family protein [Sorangium sp. So ce131]|uniref:type VI secretion system Vgr family protein n=1 Tax=Sorangium sp. So ce131 TaxID=3133282 RepID=UPI003F5FCBC6